MAVFLPAMKFGFVQDDRAIIAQNPAAHSVGAAARAFDDPYWPRESGAGLYRPLTILSFAIDWTVSGGRAGWLHAANALWHGLVTVLFALVMARWLAAPGWILAALIFAWHPLHVEAVAGLVGRAELVAAAGILGSVFAARRGWWAGAVVCAALAMLGKEHGVIAGVVILLDRWLEAPNGRPYPAGLWIGLAVVTAGFLAAWVAIGGAGASDVAPVFIGRDVWERLAVALPAVARAAQLLVWPDPLSVDYGPQVIPATTSLSLAAVVGGIIVASVPAVVLRARRRAPAVAFALGVGALAYLPTANLLFASGVVLAERNLYLLVMVPAALVGWGITWLVARQAKVHAIAVSAALSVGCLAVTLDRLPVWRDNRVHLLALLEDHPESSRAHASAAAVLAGIGDTAGARREYRIADSLFSGDPFVTAAHAILLLSLGDTAAAAPLVARLGDPHSAAAELMATRVRFLASLSRGDTARARVLAAGAKARAPWEESWYRQYLQ